MQSNERHYKGSRNYQENVNLGGSVFFLFFYFFPFGGKVVFDDVRELKEKDNRVINVSVYISININLEIVCGQHILLERKWMMKTTNCIIG